MVAWARNGIVYSASMRRAAPASAEATSPSRRPMPSGRARPSRSACAIVPLETR